MFAFNVERGRVFLVYKRKKKKIYKHLKIIYYLINNNKKISKNDSYNCILKIKN